MAETSGMGRGKLGMIGTSEYLVAVRMSTLESVVFFRASLGKRFRFFLNHLK